MDIIDWEKYIVKINVKSLIIDFNNPMNLSNINSVSGTGFFLSDYIILTCYHVVKYAKDIEIIFNQTNISKAQILYICPDDDIALLYIKTNIPESIKLDTYIVKNKIKSTVYAIGFPMDSNSVIITKGIISGYRNSLIQIDATLNPGNSGGPLVIFDESTKKWKLLGINTSKNSEGENMGFVLPIYRFLLLKSSIITYAQNNNYPNVIHKPSWDFKYQLIKQPSLRKILFKDIDIKSCNFSNDEIGVRVSCMSKNNYLKKYFDEDDILLSINNNNIDINGYIKINNFPEKIKIKDINLWYSTNNTVEVKILKYKLKKIENVNITFEIAINNLMKFYGLKNFPSYYVNNNNLILSIITNQHIKILPKLNFNLFTILKIYNRISYPNDMFTVYLADLDPNIYENNKFNKFPVGKIIIEINNKTFDDFETFSQIIKEPIKVFKTIDNDIFYID